jgi:hypothetical protein
MARPTKCTPQVTETICEHIRQGVPQETSAALAGISERTFYDWMSWGAAGREPWAQFSQSVARARAECEAALIADVRDGLQVSGKPDWKSRQRLLETLFPERHGQTIQIKAKVDQELERLLKAFEDAHRSGELSTDEYRKVLTIAARSTGEVEGWTSAQAGTSDH